MKKKIFLSAFVFMAAFASVTVLKTQAGTETGRGWLWGGTGDGGSPVNYTGVGWISMNNINPTAGGSVSYGVNVPDLDGPLSGYAWSENIGWISFNETDLSGCAGATQAVRSESSIQGWARIMGIKTESEEAIPNAGGWLGCVKLSGTAQNGSPFGVQIISGVSPAPDTLSGYAWSDELGWIDFSSASIEPPACAEPPTYSCLSGVCTTGKCGQTASRICTETKCGTTENVDYDKFCGSITPACSDNLCPPCDDGGVEPPIEVEP